MTTTIRVPWQDPYDKDFMWNNLLSWTVETFGLPSDTTYQYHPDHDYMDFHFYNEQDALMFQLKSGGYIWSKQDQAVDLMGVYINAD